MYGVTYPCTREIHDPSCFGVSVRGGLRELDLVVVKGSLVQGAAGLQLLRGRRSTAGVAAHAASSSSEVIFQNGFMTSLTKMSI